LKFLKLQNDEKMELFEKRKNQINWIVEIVETVSLENVYKFEWRGNE
jgi:hypothetical protein